MSQGENVLEELYGVEASEVVLHARPRRISDATATATTAATAVRNPSTGPIAIASPPPQFDAHLQTSSSAMRNERPPVDSPSRGAGAATEAASVALMLCELKTTTTTTTAMENSSAFVTPSIP